jgi:hypothetical protein
VILRLNVSLLSAVKSSFVFIVNEAELPFLGIVIVIFFPFSKGLLFGVPFNSTSPSETLLFVPNVTVTFVSDVTFTSFPVLSTSLTVYSTSPPSTTVGLPSIFTYTVSSFP